MDPTNTSLQPTRGFIYQRCPHQPNDPQGPSLCLQCSALSEVDIQLATAQQWLSDLKATQCRIKSEINQANDTLLKAFPTEIICKIFELCITPCSVMSTESEGYSNPAPQLSPLRLGAICKTWRDIAWATPTLWSYIVIQLDSKIFTTSAGYEIAEGWFKRSGSRLPLGIRVYQRYPNPGHHIRYGEDSTHSDKRIEPGDRPTLEQKSRVMDLVNGYSHRWMLLDLQLPRHLLGRVKKQTDPTGNIRARVHLLVLRVHETDASMLSDLFQNPHWNAPHQMLFSDLHAPVTLRLIDTRIDYMHGVKWKNLRSLFANRTNTCDLLTIISNAPHLESIDVHVPGYHTDPMPPTTDQPGSPCVRPSLRKIKFSTGSAEGLEIFRRVVMPSLTSIELSVVLQFSTGYQAPQIVPRLTEFIKSSRPPVNTFVLEIPSVSVAHTLQFLHTLPPTVTALTLKRGSDPEIWTRIFDHFGRPCKALGGQILFPNLRDITFEYPILGGPTPVCWNAIVTTLRNALNSEPRRPFIKKLERLTIRYQGPPPPIQTVIEMTNETAVRLAEFIERDGVPLRVVAKLSAHRMRTMMIAEEARERFLANPNGLLTFAVIRLRSP